MDSSLIVALIGAAIIILLAVDLSHFKSNLEGYVSEITGRQFVIAGRFEPSIGKTVFSTQLGASKTFRHISAT